MRRTNEKIEDADLVLLVIDGSHDLDDDDQDYFGKVEKKKRWSSLTRRTFRQRFPKNILGLNSRRPHCLYFRIEKRRNKMTSMDPLPKRSFNEEVRFSPDTSSLQISDTKMP